MIQQKINRFLLSAAIVITVAVSIFIIRDVIEKRNSRDELTLLRIQETKLSIQLLEQDLVRTSQTNIPLQHPQK